MHERLARAKQYLAIAESDNPRREAYIRAAEEIVAHKHETGESNAVVARALQCAPRTVDYLVKWHKSGFKAPTPFLMDEQATTRASISHTKRILREAPAEVVERIVSELPDDRLDIVVGAADGEYHRREEIESSGWTDEERQQAGERASRAVKTGVIAPIKTGGLVATLELAVAELNELMEDGLLDAQLMRAIDKAHEEWVTAYEFAKQMTGTQA